MAGAGKPPGLATSSGLERPALTGELVEDPFKQFAEAARVVAAEIARAVQPIAEWLQTEEGQATLEALGDVSRETLADARDGKVGTMKPDEVSPDVIEGQAL